ncbi:MerR family transcriptional regulator [Nocardia sp. NPDC049190]|uniref:MerR family transcriptional regulator n=1 Tax=Nocardia sp. NPDC049190 TaxID=3155650 RepID=UPI0033E61BB3
MLIGELAALAGTSTRALRYYEQRGLVRARRCANGYRVYDEAELQVVRKIRALLDTGFDLADIRPFVTCLRDGNDSGDVCPDSVAVLRRKVGEVEDALARLNATRDQLHLQLTDAMNTRRPPACEFR